MLKFYGFQACCCLFLCVSHGFSVNLFFLMEPEDQDLRTGSDFMANRLVFCGSFPDDKAMSEEKAAVSQVRIDKWLWAARFFKTRALAVQAVSGGKVQVNGNRVRSSRIVQIGEILRVRRGEEEFTITVLARRACSMKSRKSPYVCARNQPKCGPCLQPVSPCLLKGLTSVTGEKSGHLPEKMMRILTINKKMREEEIYE